MGALTESQSYLMVGEYMDRFQADVSALDKALGRLGRATEAQGETLKARGKAGSGERERTRPSTRPRACREPLLRPPRARVGVSALSAGDRGAGREAFGHRAEGVHRPPRRVFPPDTSHSPARSANPQSTSPFQP